MPAIHITAETQREDSGMWRPSQWLRFSKAFCSSYRFGQMRLLLLELRTKLTPIFFQISTGNQFYTMALRETKSLLSYQQNAAKHLSVSPFPRRALSLPCSSPATPNAAEKPTDSVLLRGGKCTEPHSAQAFPLDRIKNLHWICLLRERRGVVLTFSFPHIHVRSGCFVEEDHS